MLDAELVNEMDTTARRVGGITRMPAETAEAYVLGLAKMYVADPSGLYWWESLKCRPVRISYEDTDGLAQLARVVGLRSDARLVVTDDERPPWPVYSGDAQKLIAMLRECRFFEYILAAHDMSWLVFDTHMNELVCVGLDT